MNLFVGDIKGTKAYLHEDEIQHCIKVLRKNVGDKIYITDGKGKCVKGPIEIATKKQVEISVQKSVELPSVSTGLHLAVALTKNIDRFEFLIEKATELGAASIQPIFSFHSERKKVNEDKLHKKAIAANKQCLRSHFLSVQPLISLDQFIERHKDSKVYFAHCYDEYSKLPIQEIAKVDYGIVLIGPEGDFSKEEVEKMNELSHFQALSLGPNRLRTETAAIYSAAYFYSQFT